jgi:hypothetical protein
MLWTLLLFADKPADVVSGGVLTLVLPLGITIVVFIVWYFVLRGRARGD